MSNEIADDHQHAIERFWHNYFSILEKSAVPSGSRKCYRRHVEMYIAAHKEIRLAQHSAGHVDKYLTAKGRRSDLEEWRFRQDATDTLEDALQATGLKQARVHHKPRLLSDTGPCYISSELKTWLKNQQMEHTRGAPYHPMTQGKIERYHRSMKNVVKLEHYYYPWQLKKAIADWVAHYNHERYHESLDNVTPADVYHGRREEILDQRAIIKSRTLMQSKVQNLRLAG